MGSENKIISKPCNPLQMFYLCLIIWDINKTLNIWRGVTQFCDNFVFGPYLWKPLLSERYNGRTIIFILLGHPGDMEIVLFFEEVVETLKRMSIVFGLFVIGTAVWRIMDTVWCIFSPFEPPWRQVTSPYGLLVTLRYEIITCIRIWLILRLPDKEELENTVKAVKNTLIDFLGTPCTRKLD